MNVKVGEEYELKKSYRKSSCNFGKPCFKCFQENFKKNNKKTVTILNIGRYIEFGCGTGDDSQCSIQEQDAHLLFKKSAITNWKEEMENDADT